MTIVTNAKFGAFTYFTLKLGKKPLVFQAGFPLCPPAVTLLPHMQNFVYQLVVYLL